ncbi:MAG: hypothetical protein N2746_01395 [Deltaproteobacteria bacterium]|nr:hypothetical protein [Deltaproteobacteria bacterium]
MKNLILCSALIAVTLLGSFVFSCSDDDEAKLDCNKFCEKMKECKTQEEPEVESCQTLCKNINEKGYFDGDYLKRLNSCMSESCEKINECADKAKSKCPPVDDSKYYEALCAKMIECKKTSDTKEKCIETQKKEGNDFSCMTEKYISDMASCFSKVSCGSYLDDMMNCTLLLLK